MCLLFLNVVQQFINNSFLPCLFPLLFKVAVVSTYPIISAQYSSFNYSWLNNNFILTFARLFRSNYLSVSTRHTSILESINIEIKMIILQLVTIFRWCECHWWNLCLHDIYSNFLNLLKQKLFTLIFWKHNDLIGMARKQ